MDVKELIIDELNELYFGPGLDNGSTVTEFVEQVKAGVDEWARKTIEELKDDPDFAGVAK